MAGPGKADVAVGRSTVYSKGGIVCSISPVAATAGARVLAEGGNAFDAAVATAAVESVTAPAMCGLGGEPFVLMYEAASGKVTGLSGSGRAPSAFTRDSLVAQGYSKMPIVGPLSAAIPGEVDAWAGILERFGTKSLSALLEPAIGYAEDGYALSASQARGFQLLGAKLNQYPDTAKTFTKNGIPFEAGDVLVQHDLARTLRRIASGGADEVYRGETGRELVRALQAAGSPYTLDELGQHRTEWYESPISTTYRGHTVYETRPPSQGLILLGMLNIMESQDLAGMGFYTPNAIHVMVEAKKLAFADRNAYMQDPAFDVGPVDELISKSFAERRRTLLDMSRVATSVEPGPIPAPVPGDGDTSYFCVIDGEGNALSFIHSLSHGFGSGFVAGSTGIMLNNRLGRGFSLVDGHPNVVEPGKRPMHTLNAYMAVTDGKLTMVGGTPGGDRQIFWNAQVISNVVDHGMDAQQAVEAPRWTHTPGTDPATIDDPFVLQVEPGLSELEIADLRSRGHDVNFEPSVGGSAKLIMIDSASGVRTAGSDPRTDGHAVAV